jgi:hypothetical protein
MGFGVTVIGGVAVTLVTVPLPPLVPPAGPGPVAHDTCTQLPTPG